MQVPSRYTDLALAIRSVLSDDLRKEPYRGDLNPMSGHCYVASQAFYYLVGGKAAGFKPVVLRMGEVTHWWIESPEGEVIDLTADQFAHPVPYDRGRGCGFQNPDPSQPDARTRVVLERLAAAGLIDR